MKLWLEEKAAGISSNPDSSNTRLNFETLVTANRVSFRFRLYYSTVFLAWRQSAIAATVKWDVYLHRKHIERQINLLE